MEPFDKDYLERREKQIKELYELRAMSWACLITTLALAAIGAILMSSSKTLGMILVVGSLLFGMGTIFMFADYFSRKAADRAFQQEYEQLLAVYGQSFEKAKRSGQSSVPDDGELPLADSLQDSLRAGARGDNQDD